ncbi:MAG: DUF2993 domain-containing protein [Fimbriimonas sp.]
MSQSLVVGPFQCSMANVVLPMGLNLDRVRLSGEGLRVAVEPFAIAAPKAGDLEVIVFQASLAAFLNKKQPGGLRDIEVELKEGRVYVTGTKRVLIDVRANAVCLLRVVEGTKIFVEVESVDLLGAGAKNLMQSQLDQMNPVLDLREFPVNATIESLHIAGGSMTLRGKIAP